MELPICMNVVGRSGVMFIKAMETGRGGCSSQHETMDVARSESQGRAATMRTLFTWQLEIDLLLMAFGVSPTPTRFPTNILYTPMDCTAGHFLPRM